jgi:hypothetical protein
MSIPGASGNIVELYQCPPELGRQFTTMLGNGVRPARLIQDFRRNVPANEARAVIRSFTSDLEVTTALRAAYEGILPIGLDCEPDQEKTHEVAHYLQPLEDTEEGERAKTLFSFSPNAIKTLHRPVLGILRHYEQEDAEDPAIRFTAVGIAYKGVFANVLAQSLVKNHLLISGQASREGISPALEEKVSILYQQKFANSSLEHVDDLALRVNRLAMCLGGAAMFRQVAESIDKKFQTEAVETNPKEIGMLLKMYAGGLLAARPTDEQHVAFPLAHAFSPKEAAHFMKHWFGA